MDPLQKLRELIAGNQESVLKELLQSRLLERKDPAVKQPKTNREMYQALTQEEPFLKAISAVESSGGLDVAHNPDPKSGTTAGGMFGFMPRTGYDVLKRNPELRAKYPQLQEAALSDDHAAFTEALNTDPQLARDLAQDHLKHNKDRLKTKEELAYAWLNGVRGTKRAVKQGKNLKEHPYVQKILANYQEPSPQVDQKMIDLETSPAENYEAVEVLKKLLRGNK